jgi:hypothetical protein
MTYIKPYKLNQRIYVGSTGQYDTLKEAVDYFNSSATSNMEILVDAGHHLITDTITVNNSSYDLQIRGLGSLITIIEASTGLTNKPMFSFKTNCDINKVTLAGNTLTSYGTLSTENAINFDGTVNIGTEVTDIIIDTFNIGLYDTKGTDIFTFNALYLNITTAAIRINTTETNQYLDCEVVTFENCGIGIDLLKANTGGFYINTCFFINSSNQIAVKYTGGTGNYVYTGITTISDCTFNNVGTFFSGFNFSGGVSPLNRDAGIVLVNNPGYENKNPHAKVGILNNTTTTTITTANTFYKAAGFLSKTILSFDLAATAGTFTYTVGDQTTAAIAYNVSAANFKAALEALSNVTTVTVTQVVASKEWIISFDTTDEGWVAQSCNTSGLTTTTRSYVKSSSYQTKFTITANKVLYQPTNTRDMMMWVSCNVINSRNGRNTDIAIVKNGNVLYGIFGQMTVSCASNASTYPISTTVYLEEVTANDYFELWVTTNGTNGDTVIVQDVSWLIDSK